jgi:ArsR family transcriptional regulator
MPHPLTDLEALFKALADETRLRILGLLLSGEVCVCHIHESLRIPQPKASRHLAYLRRAGLVDARKDGLWVHYTLADSPSPVRQAVQQAVRHALQHLDVVQRDFTRLQKRTGCCQPVFVEGGAPPPCCADLPPGQVPGQVAGPLVTR